MRSLILITSLIFAANLFAKEIHLVKSYKDGEPQGDVIIVVDKQNNISKFITVDEGVRKVSDPSELKNGVPVITRIFGRVKVLSLFSSDFDTKTGGNVVANYLYERSGFSLNYRDMHFELTKSEAGKWIVKDSEGNQVEHFYATVNRDHKGNEIGIKNIVLE